MRVAIIQKDLKNLRSGVSRLVRAELEAIQSEGHESILISEKVKPVAYEGTRTVVKKTRRWPFKGYFRRHFFKLQSERLLRKLEPDVSIAHGDASDVDVCFIHNCVHLEHEIIHRTPLPDDNDVGRMHTQILKEQKFKVLVCNSELMKNDLKQRFEIYDKPIEVLYPCCDPSTVTKPTLDMRDVIRAGDNDIVIGLITSGNFKKRNVRFFLKVCAQLQFKHPLHIVVAGNGKAAEFASITKDYPHAVHFLPSANEVANYYNMLDIFVLPAHIEEFGMSALEAMTCKKAVVLHGMVGASEILEGESRGFVLSNLDVERWVSALQNLVEDKSLRERVAFQNSQTAKKYTAQEQDKQFMGILHRVYRSNMVDH